MQGKTNKFSVGDRVRSNQPGESYTGTITEIRYDDKLVIVNRDDGHSDWHCKILEYGIATARGYWDGVSMLEKIIEADKPIKEQRPSFKDGDRVTCCIQGIFIEDGVISIEKDRGSYGYGRPFICQNYKDGSNATDKKGYKYSWVLKDDFTQTDVTDLKLKEEKKVIDYSVGVENAMDFKVGYKVVVKKGSSGDSDKYHGNEGIIVGVFYSPWVEKKFQEMNTNYNYLVRLYDGREICLWGNDFDIIEPGYECGYTKPVHIIDPKVGCSIDPGSINIDDTATIGIDYHGLVHKAIGSGWIMSTGSSTTPVFKKKRVNFFID